MKHQETTSQQYNFSIIKHGDISTPQGFTAGGMHIGLRANKKDFGWIYSSSLASAAAVYTLNQFKAAHLLSLKTLYKSLKENYKHLLLIQLMQILVPVNKA